MNKELIEKLKKNEKPFGLLTTEEKSFIHKLRKTEYRSIQYFTEEGDWTYIILFAPDCVAHLTYRIAPEYMCAEEEQEEFEVRPINPVERRNGRYCFEYNGYPYFLHDAIDLPNFSGVQFEGQENNRWYYSVRMWKQEDSNCLSPIYYTERQDQTIAIPVRIRFKK